MVLFKGSPVHTAGEFPHLHTQAPDFHLVNGDLQDISLHDPNFKGKRKLLATVPSLDTGVCSIEAKHLNEFAHKHQHIRIIVVSADLPFAQKRFCGMENVHNVSTLSMMRDKDFGKAYGVLLLDGPLAGLLARALFVLDEKDRIIYTQLVSEITHEPDYHAALKEVLK